MYDLMVAPPHVPADRRYTPDEFRLYREGYDWALVIALRALTAAEERFKLVTRTRALETRRKRERE